MTPIQIASQLGAQAYCEGLPAIWHADPALLELVDQHGDLEELARAWIVAWNQVALQATDTLTDMSDLLGAV